MLQKDIDELVKWTDQWQIKFNSTKCKILHVGNNNPRHKYFIEGRELEVTDLEKDLGVHVDSQLTFDGHICEVIKKSNRLVGMISRVIHWKDKDIMTPLFKSLVRPILEYGNVVWHPYLIKHITLIENIQRRFTKRIVGMSDLDYVDRLRLLKLPSLEFRRLRGDMIETFKILNGYYDPATTKSFFCMCKTSTRGNSLKLSKKHVSTNHFANFFTNRVVNNWNSLPEHLVKASSVNSFKNLLDKHWSSYTYSLNINILH